MNRFGNITGLPLIELAPWEIKRRGLPMNQAWYETQEQLFFDSDIAGYIIVPSKFVTNDANIPALARPFLNSNAPVISLGAVIHDWLYFREGKLRDVEITREQADRILAFEAMPELGANRFQQQAVYQSLKYFGDRWK